MRSGGRILLFALIGLELGQLPAAGQSTGTQRFPKQGRIAVRQEAATSAEGAAQGMQAPVLGFVSSAGTGELRALLGIPGASALGAPLAVTAGLLGVYFAPNQSYALLAPKAGNSLGLMTFQGAHEHAIISICGALPQPDIVAFSPGASAAALYSKTEERLQVITGLPDSPHLARVVAASELPDELRFLAVTDDGATLVEGTAQSAVYLLPQLGSPRLLYTAGDLQGMAFAPHSNDLVAFDRARSTAFLLQNVDGASSYLPLADSLTGLDGNVFLETSRAGAVIASTNSTTVWKIDLRSLEVESIHLPGMPQMLEPLRIPGDYLLFYRVGFPAWILDSNGVPGSVSFVPASAAPRRRTPFPLTAARDLNGDQNEQPESVSQPVSGAGCTGAPEPTPATNPLPWTIR